MTKAAPKAAHPAMPADSAVVQVTAAPGDVLKVGCEKEKGRVSSGSLSVSLVTVYNGALLCALYYFVNACIDDFRDNGRLSIVDWTFVATSFSPATLTIVFTLWTACNAALVVGHLGFICWRYGRASLHKKFAGAGTAWDWCWSVAAALLHVAILVGPLWISRLANLHPTAVLALSAEQTRLFMKSFAYLREHVRAALAKQPSNDSLCHLVFYMFAPTFIYRDSYERTPRVRLLVAVRHACIFALSVCTMVMVVVRSGLRPFCAGADTALIESTSLSGLPLYLATYWITTMRMAPGSVVLFVGTSIALHSWNSVFAELMRFPTNRFVQAWWNASTHETFFRDWNLFVKSWLQKYVFKELLAHGLSGTAARLITVVVSAVGHEMLLAATLGFVVPYFSFLYVFGIAILSWDPMRVQVKTRGNFAMLLFISIGLSMTISFYIMEAVARIHCPRKTNELWDIFVPRSLFCEKPQFTCSLY